MSSEQKQDASSVDAAAKKKSVKMAVQEVLELSDADLDQGVCAMGGRKY